MGISAADPARLPSSSQKAPVQVTRPNAFRLPANVWTRVTAPLPSYAIITTASAATITAFPGEIVGNPATQTEVYPAYQIGATTYLVELHAIGPWHILSTVAATSAVIFDSFDGLQTLLRALKAVNITGGTSGLAADTITGTGTEATTFNRLIVDAVLRGLNAAGNAFNLARADTGASAAQDETQANIRVQSLIRGIDSTAGAGSRSLGVEARTGNNFDGTALTVPLLGVASQGFARDAVGGTTVQVGGLRELTGVTPIASGTLQMRKFGYWGGLRDRRFVITMVGNNVNAAIAAYSSTTPSLLLVAPATNELIIRRVWLSLAENSTAIIHASPVVDPDNRYSSGGTSFTPTGGFKSTNRGGSGALTPTQALYDNGGGAPIVATATDNDELYLGDKTFGVSSGTVCPAGSELIWEPEDDIIVPPSGSFLLHVWGEVVDFTFAVEIESANIQ